MLKVRSEHFIHKKIILNNDMVIPTDELDKKETIADHIMIAIEQIKQEVKQEEEEVSLIAHQSKQQKMENSKGKELGVNLL